MTAQPHLRSRLLLPLVVLVAAIGITIGLFVTAPETAPEEKSRSAKIVQVIAVESHTAKISVTAYGTVVPAQRIDIQPEVGGRVVHHHPEFVPGGRIAADEQMIMIDPADYELVVAEREAELKEAEYELALERGRQVVARREWRLLETDLDESEVNRSLVLREPHLMRAVAAVDKANNAIAKAQLDLSRTKFTAPFNAVVINESVEIGQLIEPGKTIASLAGTDEFWVQISLPIEDLRWIQFPESAGGENATGAKASITLDTGDSGTVFSWEGTVERLLGDLESSGRMARVLVAVADPLAGSGKANGLPLLLDSYVRVDIEAGELDDVIAIPRAALRDGQRLWGVDADNKLQIHDTELRWVEGETLLVTNTLPPGEDLIVSRLRAALPGMAVDPQPASAPAPASE